MFNNNCLASTPQVIGGNRVVELRDIFPTMLDAIGTLNGERSVVPKGYKMDGDSLLCLLGNDAAGTVGSDTTCRGGAWRPFLDLEHYKVRRRCPPLSAEIPYFIISLFPILLPHFRLYG